MKNAKSLLVLAGLLLLGSCTPTGPLESSSQPAEVSSSLSSSETVSSSEVSSSLSSSETVSSNPSSSSVVSSSDEVRTKSVTITPENLDAVPYLTMSNVIPNAKYPNEFTMQKGGSSISSSLIKKVTKIVATIYSTTNRLTVYGALTGGTAITPSTAKNTGYSSATDLTFEMNGVDAFRIENTSTSDQHLYSLTIYFEGDIDMEGVVIETEGEIDINAVSLNKIHTISQEGVTIDGDNLVFAPNAKIETVVSAKVKTVCFSEASALPTVYAVNGETSFAIIPNADGLFDTQEAKVVRIVNETASPITMEGIFITYEPVEKEKEELPQGGAVSIAQAVTIAAGLDRNRGTTTEEYTITGVVTELNGSSAKIEDGGSYITAYSTAMPANVVPGYRVTLKGQLQNYYGKAEIVNFTVVSYVATTFSITTLASEHGTFTVSKTSDIAYGEQVTITCTPDSGYVVKKVSLDGRTVPCKDNVAVATITGNCTITVVFAEPVIDTDPVGEGFKIVSLEMMGTYGDAILIKYGDFDILFDAGTEADGPGLKTMLQEQVTDGVLDLIIHSHPDSDHYAGASAGGAFAGISSINRLIVNTNHGDTANMIGAVQKVSPSATIERAIDLTSSNNRTYTIEVDNDFSIDIMWNSLYATGSKNNSSIPAIVNYKNTKVFMGGDMENAACDAFMQTYPGMFSEEDFIIFKGLHHGSNGSNSDAWMSYLKPDMAFVSAPLKTASDGTPGYSNHPYLNAMERIGAVTDQLYWAGINGELTIQCDGYRAKAEGRGRTRDYKYQGSIVSRAEESDITFCQSKWWKNVVESEGRPDYAGICN